MSEFTHLVDLAPWILFPQQVIDYKKDIRLLSAERWPTVMPLADFVVEGARVN